MKNLAELLNEALEVPVNEASVSDIYVDRIINNGGKLTYRNETVGEFEDEDPSFLIFDTKFIKKYKASDEDLFILAGDLSDTLGQDITVDIHDDGDVHYFRKGREWKYS